MIYFLDTSALVKRYVVEPGSTEVRALFRRNRDVAVARVTSAELAASVARLCREGLISDDARDAILERTDRDFARMTVVELRGAVLMHVAALVRRWPLRAYDAVQLASALTLRSSGVAVSFWSGDGALIAAARGEGLRTSWSR